MIAYVLLCIYTLSTAHPRAGPGLPSGAKPRAQLTKRKSFEEKAQETASRLEARPLPGDFHGNFLPVELSDFFNIFFVPCIHWWYVVLNGYEKLGIHSCIHRFHTYLLEFSFIGILEE